MLHSLKSYNVVNVFVPTVTTITGTGNISNMVQSWFIRYTFILRDCDFHAHLIIFKACYYKLQSNLSKRASMDVGHGKKQHP